MALILGILTLVALLYLVPGFTKFVLAPLVIGTFLGGFTWSIAALFVASLITAGTFGVFVVGGILVTGLLIIALDSDVKVTFL